ncbi:hypothetical protein ACFQZZ_22985 [Nocardia sp. GCM10030253]|uniref:hypothetical protein n=1 Tax=Nocardia sp. GCM10030253 TaxID=3273404 RepID=UPI003639F415
MRRSVRAVPGVLMITAVIAAAPMATAAQGELIVDDTTYKNPHGCLYLGVDKNRSFTNNTDNTISIYPTTGCLGFATAILPAGESGTYTSKSVQIG